MVLWCSKPKGRGSITGLAASSFTLVSEWKKPMRYNEKSVAVQQLARWFNGQSCGTPRPRGPGSISSWVKSTFKLVSEWKKPIRKL